MTTHNKMKLLSFYIAPFPANHDSSISYYDGKKLHHVTMERYTRKKHDVIKTIEEVKKIIKVKWDLKVEDCDLISVICPNKKYIQFHDFFNKNNVIVIDHHLAHYYSAKLISSNRDNKCKGFVIDGVGEPDVCWSLYDNDRVVDKGSVINHGSIGIFLTHYGLQVAGIKVPNNHTGHVDVAGKLMGLQSYGNIDYDLLRFLEKKVPDLNHILNVSCLRITDAIDGAHTLFYHFENLILSFFRKNFNRDDTILYSGGIAMNVLWNSKIKKEFPNLVIPPYCGDMGLSLGGIEYLREKNNIPKFELINFPYIEDDESPETLPNNKTIQKAAELLADNEIIAWYQGNGEVGPRALGNRSILLNPMIENGKDLINNIKKREYFRPFGGVVLDEYKTEYFNVDESFDNPYMLYAADVKDDRIGSITHIDGTCRIQTLKNENPVLRNLMERFYDLTGCPVLLNTSLNVTGEPIMSTRDKVDELLMTSELNYAFVGNEMIGDKVHFSYG